MSPIDLKAYLVLGAILFGLGLVGFLTRRNMIIMFLSAELMLQGVAVDFLAFGRFRGNWQGQSFVLFILTVAACEAAIAMGLVYTLYRLKNSLDSGKWSDLREEGLDSPDDLEGAWAPAEKPDYPVLPLAGIKPQSGEETSHV
ncbi:MAG: NADH-quinone oxidoreductase subunit NuoK [Gemmataceae bacterium]|nr:NADH-quinone oxidoreductase subunit NuoK [Gemmataceae bacterium]